MKQTDSGKTRIEELPLHDVTLESAAFDWKTGELRLILGMATNGSMAVLSFFNTNRLNANREQPWGPSVSINEVRTLQDGEVEIEMQSGDAWNIYAESWTLAFTPRREA